MTMRMLSLFATTLFVAGISDAFPVTNVRRRTLWHSSRYMASPQGDSQTTDISSVGGASRLLFDWDQKYNSNVGSRDVERQRSDESRPMLPGAVRYLCQVAEEERSKDSTRGRCMLGICASNVAEGVNTLKSWVTELGLPRGLLHGMDKDGVPVEIDGGVYIKYNTGGCITFAEIRKSGLGFDALWKPGDALLEHYDGSFRGVYFQVELADGEFRQYLVPLDTFSSVDG